MEGFFNGLEQAIRERNWHAALVMTLTLPDICVKASDPSRKTSGKRYAEWFDTYLGPTYTSFIGPPLHGEEVKFLSGADCYALRCALLHEGSSDTSGQSAKEALEKFHFYVPGEKGNSNHRNLTDDGLTLMVDMFAAEMLGAARTWWSSLTPEVRAATESRMLRLHGTDDCIALR